MPPQYIFTIENVSKSIAKREILKNIWLSFYPGAKIGVLGGNGAGKSTLLRIMAGVDKDFVGTARPAPGTRIGYLAQEPLLDPTLDVRGNVELAVASTRALLNRYDEINRKLGEPIGPDEMEKLLDEQGRVQDAIEAANAWELDRNIEIAMDAMRSATRSRRRRPRAARCGRPSRPSTPRRASRRAEPRSASARSRRPGSKRTSSGRRSARGARR